jgi:lysophospholipase L1-like esterase
VGGAAGSSGIAGAGGANACQHGQVAGNEVLIVGDSYFALSGEITKELRRLSGANYRDVSVSGTKMGAIANSYTNNRTPQPKVVIMDGGGNDILQNPGCTPGCAQEVQAVTEAKNFLKQMATDGVGDVVFLFYYDMPSMKAGLDWMRPKMAAECEQSPVPCHFVDNQPLFAGMDASTYTIDGIHPNTETAHIIAKQVWDRMQQECIAQ